MNKLQLACVGACVLGVAGSALAAERPVPVRRAPAYVPAAFSWTGCYVGANVGWLYSRDDYSTRPAGNYLTPNFVPANGAAPNAAGTGLSLPDILAVSHLYSSTSSGVEVGPHVGCDYQITDGFFKNIVIGAVADWSWSSVRNSNTLAVGPIQTLNNNGAPLLAPQWQIAPELETVTSRLDWFTTVRARIGIAVDHFLVYGTGGWAETKKDSNFTSAFGIVNVAQPVLNGAVHFGSFSSTQSGWVVGAGLEYAIPGSPWAINLEWLWLDTPTRSFFSPLAAAARPFAPGYAWYTQDNERDYTLRFSLSYRFGSYALPLAVTK